jgi:RimJ/RimL family protein N-acetyltransferase
MPSSSFWPMTDLRLRTPRLELRWPGEADLAALAELAAAGIHDPSVQPFAVPWTDVPPAERARSVLQYQWGRWAAWQPSDWTLALAVVEDGIVVGLQGISGHDFAVTRRVSTGSWLGQAYQGRGIGTQMRAAVLYLAFAGLNAQHAVSSAYESNVASLAVSRRLGYADDGIDVLAIRGRPVVLRRLRLDRTTWQGSQDAPDERAVPVEIAGLEPCLPHFGLAG